MLETKKLHPSKRIHNFEEVNMGISEKDAVKEAQRCLNCANPQCVTGCPARIDIPAFIKHIANSEFELAARKIREANNIPSVCGRVCPQENYCELKCILNKNSEPISIGLLERFAADYGNLSKSKIIKPKKIGKSVAVVGSGPSGITVSGDLARLGYNVTMFEALHEPGGVLTYGIPDFRLPVDVVKREIEYLTSLGVEIKKNHVIGNVFSLQHLKDKYDAVFLGVGAGLPNFMSIPGESLNHVYSANEYLTRVNLMHAHTFPNHHTPMKKHKKTIVIGGGNVAMDSARVAKRLGSDVTLLYRRSIDEMPARNEEVRNAQEEGVEMLMMTNVQRIFGTENVNGIECIQMMLGEEDSSGRRKPIPIDDSEFNLECDSVIIAIGQTPNPLLISTTNLQKYKNGTIIIDKKMRTSEKGVFAGGDIVSGDTSVIKAVGDGKKAVDSIHEYLNGKV